LLQAGIDPHRGQALLHPDPASKLMEDCTMKKLTLEVEKLTVDSFETGVAAQDCPTASATATPRPGLFSNTTSGRA
jgi:hypothetical protein